jgi:hypothetical protein
MNTEKQILKETYDRMLNSQWAKDFDKPMSINGMESNKATYNLFLCIREVRLFSKGLKPHRNWRLKDVKNYFNINGNTIKVLNQLEQIKDFLSND